MQEERTVKLLPKDWASRVEAESWRLRGIIVIFLLCAYGFVLVATMAIFFLQGFKTDGFNLSEKVLMWLGAATAGEMAGLLTLSIKSATQRDPLQVKPKRGAKPSQN